MTIERVPTVTGRVKAANAHTISTTGTTYAA
jgi:hypothetical protein